MSERLLEVSRLTTRFEVDEGTFNAVDDVSFHVDRGEVLGIVGESGSGKSVTALSIMRLIPSPPGDVRAERMIFDGVDLLTQSESAMQAIRGARISMIGLFDDRVSMPALGFLAKELTLVGSNCYARDARVGDFSLGTELVVRHRHKLPELVSHRFSLDQVVEAYVAAGDKTAGALKVQVMPGA